MSLGHRYVYAQVYCSVVSECDIDSGKKWVKSEWYWHRERYFCVCAILLNEYHASVA